MSPRTELSPRIYRDLVDAAPDAMLVVDAPTGVVLVANVQVETLLGHARDAVLGCLVSQLLPEWTPVAQDRQPGNGSEVGVPERRRSETWARHRDGRELPVEVWATPLSDEGDLVGVAIRDLAGRLAVRDASERMRDELLATVSHELRTPLTSILGYTEILVEMGEERLGAHAKRLLEAVRRNAQRELKLVEDLLMLADLGSSSLEVQPQPVDLAVLARSVLADLADPAVGAGIDLLWTGLDSLWVVGDADRLIQVVANLVGNAIKFTPPGGRVEVRFRTEGCHGLLEVEDQGMGVAPGELARVFDQMYRTPEAVAAHFPGAGLGLPIAKGIVDAHSGEIDVASQPGQGTTVQVRLPLVTAELV